MPKEECIRKLRNFNNKKDRARLIRIDGIEKLGNTVHLFVKYRFLMNLVRNRDVRKVGPQKGP